MGKEFIETRSAVLGRKALKIPWCPSVWISHKYKNDADEHDEWCVLNKVTLLNLQFGKSYSIYPQNSIYMALWDRNIIADIFSFQPLRIISLEWHHYPFKQTTRIWTLIG